MCLNLRGMGGWGAGLLRQGLVCRDTLDIPIAMEHEKLLGIVVLDVGGVDSHGVVVVPVDMNVSVDAVQH